MLREIDKHRGHVEFVEGHVHHLPITGVWNVVCYACPGDAVEARRLAVCDGAGGGKTAGDARPSGKALQSKGFDHRSSSCTGIPVFPLAQCAAMCCAP